MSLLSRDQQIQVIGCLTEGMSIRAIERLTGIHRDTIMRLGARVGRGCAELHDRIMVGLARRPDRNGRTLGICRQEATAPEAHRQPGEGRPVHVRCLGFVIPRDCRLSHWQAERRRNGPIRGRSCAGACSAPRKSRRMAFGHISLPSASEFKNSAHGVINKTFSVTHLSVHQAQHRYSPAAVIAVAQEAVYGTPSEISTSYVERSNLSIRMASRRFTRLTNGFSKKLDNHAAAVSLYVAHYNLCRVHESLRTTPAAQLGIIDRAWSLGDLIDAALAVASPDPTETAPDRRRKFRVIDGGLS